VEDGLSPISSAAAAIVVESGELTVNKLASQPLLPGQATLVAKDAYFVENAGGGPARAYLIGIVGEDDRGQVGLAIERIQGRQHACFP
jgi:hypothetical protein